MREFTAQIDIGSISSFVSAIVQAETLGVSLGLTFERTSWSTP